MWAEISRYNLELVESDGFVVDGGIGVLLDRYDRGADVARLWVSFIDGAIESGVRSARDAAAHCS